MPINLQLESNAAKSGSCRCNIISQHCYSDLTIKRGMQWATIQCIYVCHESLVQPQTAAGHWLSLCRLLASLHQLVTHDRVSTDRERPRNIAQNIDNLYLISHCSNDSPPTALEIWNRKLILISLRLLWSCESLWANQQNDFAQNRKFVKYTLPKLVYNNLVGKRGAEDTSHLKFPAGEKDPISLLCVGFVSVFCRTDVTHFVRSSVIILY